MQHKRRRVVHNAYVEIDCVSPPGPKYKNWIEITKRKLQERESKLLQVIQTKIESIVNETLRINSGEACFIVSDGIIGRTLLVMTECLNKWKGVNVSRLKKAPSLYRDYYNVSKKSWDRRKMKLLGGALWVNVFKQIHQFVCMSTAALVPILQALFCTTIKYNNTRAHPLITGVVICESRAFQEYFFGLDRTFRINDWVAEQKMSGTRNAAKSLQERMRTHLSGILDSAQPDTSTTADDNDDDNYEEESTPDNVNFAMDFQEQMDDCVQEESNYGRNYEVKMGPSFDNCPSLSSPPNIEPHAHATVTATPIPIPMPPRMMMMQPQPQPNSRMNVLNNVTASSNYQQPNSFDNNAFNTPNYGGNAFSDDTNSFAPTPVVVANNCSLDFPQLPCCGYCCNCNYNYNCNVDRQLQPMNATNINMNGNINYNNSYDYSSPSDGNAFGDSTNSNDSIHSINSMNLDQMSNSANSNSVYPSGNSLNTMSMTQTPSISMSNSVYPLLMPMDNESMSMPPPPFMNATPAMLPAMNNETFSDIASYSMNSFGFAPLPALPTTTFSTFSCNSMSNMKIDDDDNNLL